jgi:DNA-binding IclR family transcriptional regulator
MLSVFDFVAQGFHFTELDMNKTLLKGLAVIELLAHSERPLSLTEIATELGLVKSNVHRLMRGLVQARYVVRDEVSLQYSASIRLWELGSAVLLKLDLRKHAEAVMESLAAAADETVHLSVLDQDEVVYLHKVESANPIRAYTQIGGRVPAYCVATGKALLAFRSNEYVYRIADKLAPQTAATIVNAKAFFAEITRIRQVGYATNLGEWREGVYGVAAPIFDGTGNAIAAIGLSGPKLRFKPRKIREFSDLLLSAAVDITASLSSQAGYRAMHGVDRRPII